MTAAIRYLHAGDLPTRDAQQLAWNVGDVGERFQEIALVDDRVVGSWKYALEWKRGRWRIESSYTDVMPRYRRKGVARALWFAGVRRWEPTAISSTIGTDEGRNFLAAMIAELAYYRPGLHLWVKTRTEDQELWEDRCNWAAQALLTKLGERDRAKLVEAKPLKLLKGAANG